MRHLSSAEFVDLIEGTLPPERAAHAEVCSGCREHARQLGVMLDEASSAKVPEPSPLFWDHFTSRVRQAIALEPVPQSRRWLDSFWNRRALAVGAAALMALVIGSAFWLQHPSRPPSTTTAEGTARGVDESDETEAEWILVLEIAEGIGMDERDSQDLEAGLSVADEAIHELSLEERHELSRLLRNAIERSKL